MARRRTRSRKSSRRNNKSGIKRELREIEENTRTIRPYDPPSLPDKIPMVLSARRVYTFKRSTVGTTISTSTSSSTFGAASYYLASFDSTSEIAENYQQYRIIELTVKFTPIDNYTSGGSFSVDLGVIHTVIDTHNDTTPISNAELEEYKTHQVCRVGTYFSRTWTPRTLGRAYAGVTDGFYCMPVGIWLSTDYNDVNYYGIKWSLSQSVGTMSGTVYSTQIDAVIQCKNTL